jgi:hypothetical protein
MCLYCTDAAIGVDDEGAPTCGNPTTCAASVDELPCVIAYSDDDPDDDTDDTDDEPEPDA